MCCLFLPQGGVVSSRVAESYLWECKQLGAYSPIVLLNTLLFFCTKNFGYATLEQHQRLSFTNFTRCSKACSRTGKANYLLHRSSTTTPHRQETGTEGKTNALLLVQNQSQGLQPPFFVYRTFEKAADGRGAGNASKCDQPPAMSCQTVRVLPL